MSLPSVQAWTRTSWPARQRWAREHGLTPAAAHRIVLGIPDDVPVAVRPEPLRRVRPGVWTDLDHAASLAGDLDPDVVAARRAAVTGLRHDHPTIRAGLTSRSLP